MSLSILPVQDQITVKLKELPQAVYENGVPDDAQLKYSNGIMLPHIIVFYGGFARNPEESAITGPRQDGGESFAIVQCVGPTERSARQVADLVRDKLVGFTPNDGSALTISGNGRVLTPDLSTKPVKYVSELAFRYAVNMNVVL